MTTNGKGRATIPAAGPNSAAEPTTTLSTRLSADQKDLIERAAQIQSWTASNLIRKAAVERAAHILNTGRPTRFPFGAFAEKLAQQLCSPELWVEDSDGKELIQWEIYDDDREVHVGALEPYQLNQLREALELGGVEFMWQVVEACQRKLSEVGLPEPIDPSTLE